MHILLVFLCCMSVGPFFTIPTAFALTDVTLSFEGQTVFVDTGVYLNIALGNVPDSTVQMKFWVTPSGSALINTYATDYTGSFEAGFDEMGILIEAKQAGDFVIHSEPVGTYDQGRYSSKQLSATAYNTVAITTPASTVTVGLDILVTATIKVAPDSDLTVAMETTPAVGTFASGAGHVFTTAGQLTHTFPFSTNTVGPTTLSAAITSTTTPPLLYAPVTKLLTVLKRTITVTRSAATAIIGTSVVMTVTLSHPPPNELKVTLHATPDPHFMMLATMGKFGTENTLEVTFTAGQTTAIEETLTATAESTGKLMAMPTGGTDASWYSYGQVSFAVIKRTVTLTLSSASVVVGENVVVTVTLSAAPTNALTVLITTAPQLGTLGGDADTLVSFSTSETSKEVTLVSTAAGTGKFTATVGGADVNLYSNSEKAFTVLRKVTLTVLSTTVVMGSDVIVTVTLSEAPPAALTVELATTPQLGTFGSATSTILSFGTSDTSKEATLTTTVATSGQITATVGGTDAAKYKNTQLALTVLRKVTLTLSSSTVVVGSTVTVTIVLSEASANGLTVKLGTTPALGTYESVSTMDVVFGPTDTSLTKTLTTTAAGPGKVTGVVSGTDVALYTNTVEVALTVLRKVTLTVVSTTVVIGDDVVVTVTLSEATSNGLTVTLASDPQAGTFATPALTFTPSQLTLEAILTTTTAGAATVTGTVSGTDAASYEASADVAITVLRKVTLSYTKQEGVQGEVTVTVALSSLPPQALLVNLYTTQGTFVDPSQVQYLVYGSLTTSVRLQLVGTATVTATVDGTDKDLYSATITPLNVSALTMKDVLLSLDSTNEDATGSFVRVGSTSTLTVTAERALVMGETLSVELSYGDGGDTEVTFTPNPVTFVAGDTSKPVTLTGVTAHATANIAMSVLSGPEDLQAGPALALRVCAGTYTCPDDTCSTTDSPSGCACTEAAVITNPSIVSTPIAATVDNVKELIASTAMVFTVSATYRRPSSGACFEFDFAPYMTVQWSFVSGSIADRIVSNRTTIVFPALHFTVDTVYTLRATLTPLTGATTTVDFEFKAVAPVPVVTLKTLYRKVGPRDVRLLLSIVDPYADATLISWSCTGTCGSTLTSALIVNSTMTGVFLSGPLDAGTSKLTLTYKGVASPELELDVSDIEVPIVTIAASEQPAILPMTYLSTQPLVLAATVKFPTATTLSWAINGEVMEETSKLFTAPIEMLFPGEENYITVTATGMNDDGTEVYGEGRFTFMLAGEQTVEISAVANVDEDGEPLSAGVHNVQVTYTASEGVTDGTTTFAVGYMQGDTKIAMATTDDLTATFKCPIVDATELLVYVDMLINGRRVATHTIDYPIDLPEPAALVTQLTALMSAATTPADKARVALQAASVLGRGDAAQQSAMLAVVLDGLASADPATVDPITAFGAAKAARLSGASGQTLNTAVLELAAKYASTATVDNCAAILSELVSVPGSAGVTQQVGQGLAKGAEVGDPPLNCVADDGTGRAVFLTAKALSADDLSSDELAIGSGAKVSLPSTVGTFASEASIRLTATLLPSTAVSNTELASDGLQLVIYEDDTVKSINDLTDPITFWMDSSDPQYDQCMYFDEISEEWSSSGVRKLGWSATQIHCATTHLTTFGAMTGSSASSRVRWSLFAVVMAILLQLY